MYVYINYQLLLRILWRSRQVVGNLTHYKSTNGFYGSFSFPFFSFAKFIFLLPQPTFLPSSHPDILRIFFTASYISQISFFFPHFSQSPSFFLFSVFSLLSSIIRPTSFCISLQGSFSFFVLFRDLLFANFLFITIV